MHFNNDLNLNPSPLTTATSLFDCLFEQVGDRKPSLPWPLNYSLATAYSVICLLVVTQPFLGVFVINLYYSDP